MTYFVMGYPTSHTFDWSLELYGSYDRYYIRPYGSGANDNRADVSIYDDTQYAGGEGRIECDIYDGNGVKVNTLFYYITYSK